MRSDNDRPFAVDVPPAADDRPAWIRVGVIAAVGFAVGIAWPRLAGVRLGPTAPGDSPPAASAPAAPRASEPAGGTTAAAVLASALPSAVASAPAAASAPAPVGPPHVVVSRGAIVSCKTEDGEVLKGGAACGGLAGFDALAQPRIRRTRDCSAAEGATGRVSVVFGVDFANNRINVDVRGPNVTNIESIGACIKQQFGGVSLGAMDHEHPRYTMSYTATLTADGGSAQSGTSVAASTGSPAPVSMDAPTSQVVWEVAIVRDAPKSGQVVGRLQRGTKVRVGQGQENWYRVRYGSGYSNEGWVYRGAIGK